MSTILLLTANDPADKLNKLAAEGKEIQRALNSAYGKAYDVVLVPETSTEDFIEELMVPGREIEIVHYAGHAGSSSLRLADTDAAASALAEKLRSQGTVKLVFPNGCGTGDLREWSEDTIIGYLAHRGDNRLCCVTTAAEVPIGFAGAFAREFWQRFLGAGSPLGAALLATRRALLAAYNNPLGLLYEVIGQLDTHLYSPEESP